MVLKEGLYKRSSIFYFYVRGGDKAWSCADRFDVTEATSGKYWNLEKVSLKSLALPCEFLKVVT
jgi:hypothetical protein